MAKAIRIVKDKPVRMVMKLGKISLLIFLFMMLFAGTGHSQLIDSINYELDLGDFQALPDSIARMPVKLKNAISIGGFVLRIEYDTTRLTPYVLPGQEGQTILFDSLELVGRGEGTIHVDSVIPSMPPWDTNYTILASHDTTDEIINPNALFVTFWPPPPPDTTHATALLWGSPRITPETGDPTTIFNLLFKVKSTAAGSGYNYIANKQGEPREVHLSDTTGLTYILPGLGPAFGWGVFTVGSEPPDTCEYGMCGDTCCPPPVPGNDPPVVDPIVPSSYDIMQGETVTFGVTAYDPDDDDLCLEAIGLPANAVFSPSNPVCGSATVAATFSWTPSFGQGGNFAITFRATDSVGQIDSRTVTIAVEELDIDRLYTTSTYGYSPVGGIPGATPVIFPVDLASTKTVYGIQFDMTYPSDVANLDSVVVTDRIPEYVVYDNIGQYRDSVRIVTFGLNNEPVVDGSSTAILNAYMTIDTGTVPGDYWVHFYDAWESIDPDPGVPSAFLIVDSGIVQVDMLGDVNLDRHINVADLVSVVGYIIGNFGFAKRNFETANVIQDTLVNVVDLVGIINMIFDPQYVPSAAPANYAGDSASLAIEHDDLFAGQLTKLNVRGEFPDNVAGVQVQIDYDPSSVQFDRPGMGENVNNFILAYNDDQKGRMKILIYSHEPWNTESTIPAGDVDILRLPANIKRRINADDDTKIRITRAYLSSPAGSDIPVERNDILLPTTFTLYQNYPNPFNPITKIEFEIGHSDYYTPQPVRLDVFNILGQRVKTLVDEDLIPGYHSVTWDATDDKGSRVATGVYLYRLEVGDKSDSKKMLLLK